MGIALHIASEVERDPSPVGNTKQRDLNVFEIQIHRAKAVTISEPVLSRPLDEGDPIHGQFSFG
jgi:hypothetical protein